MIEGYGSTGSGSIPLYSGSGSGSPKNMWIRIRIRNTAKISMPLERKKGKYLFQTKIFWADQELVYFQWSTLILSNSKTAESRNVFYNKTTSKSKFLRKISCGSRIRIFPSRIRIKEFKYFNPKKWFLSSRKYDPGCSSRIPDPDPYFLPIPDPDPQHCGKGIFFSPARERRLRERSCPSSPSPPPAAWWRCRGRWSAAAASSDEWWTRQSALTLGLHQFPMTGFSRITLHSNVKNVCGIYSS